MFSRESLVLICNKSKWQDRVSGLKMVEEQIKNPADKGDKDLYVLAVLQIVALNVKDNIN
jgi:hypothetical protein